MNNKPEFPKRNTKFNLDSFFQLDVDEFEDGYFLFLAAKEVYIKKNRFLEDKTKWIANKGWVISTYCYTNKCWYKILVCEYQQMPWENHYHIEANLSSENNCDGYAVNNNIEEFLNWFEYGK